MNKVFIHILLVAFLACSAGFRAEAQVSVRRTTSSKKTETTTSGKGTPSATSPAKSSTPAASSSSAAGRPQTGKTGTGAAAVVPKGGSAQRPPKTTPASRTGAAQAAPGEKTLREQAFDDYQRHEAAYVPWQHVVYRELDLTKGSNASLYYPQEPVDGMTNLFRVIVDLLCNGQLKGYEYLDGREVFEDKYLVKVKDVFDKFQIMYEEKPATGRGGTAVLVVDENDVPSNEVLSYYIKERWEFDQQTSQYGPRILALCPVLHRSGDFGGDAVKYPMMWINYEDLRPYLRKHLIVSDGMNNAPRYTMEDFFALQQYRGDIYKVQNLRGLSLMQQYPNPDSLRIARARIEAELRGFSDSIWVSDEEPDVEPLPRRARRDRHAVADSTSVVQRPAADGARRNRRTKEEVDMAAVEAEQDAKEAQEDANIRATGAARSVRRSRR